MLQQLCYSRSKIAIIPTIFTGKHVQFLEISLETIIWGNKYMNMADFGPEKWKKTPILLETLTAVSSFQFFSSLMLER